MLVAQGGGGDGVAAVTDMNRPTRLRWWRAVAAAAVLRWCSARRCGEAERTRGCESERVDGVVGARCLSARSGLTSQANVDVLPPHSGHGLWSVSHDAARVHVVQTTETD